MRSRPAPGPLLTKVLIPITSPFELMSGPPEFPGFIAASVWMRSSLLSENPKLLISRCRLLTIPNVTVFSKPYGVPRAIAQSPTSRSSEFQVAQNWNK